MRILVTGASGFLGSALTRYWAAQGHELYLLARPSSRLHRLEGLPARVRLLRVSGADEAMAVVREVVPEAIVHTACAYGRKGEAPLDVFDANVRFGTALLQAVLTGPAAESGPTVFINTGTVLAPDVSLYALSKAQFSAWGVVLACQSPQLLRFIDIRLQHMYGPGDDPTKFTTHIIEACRQNEPLLALTAGEQKRDFVHIDDVVRAYDCILANSHDFATSDSIEVGSGEAITIRGFVELAKQLAGASTKLDFGTVPYRANEAMLCVADVNRLLGLGWRPAISLHDGLKKMLKTESVE